MTRTENNSISQGDGAVIGAASFGAGSHATQSGTIRVETAAAAARDAALVTGLLGRLLAQIDRHAAALPEVDRARSAAHMLLDEVGQPDPEPAVMRRMMGRLGSALRPVEPLASDFVELARAMEPLLPPEG
jgi:hypothetical protein